MKKFTLIITFFILCVSGSFASDIKIKKDSSSDYASPYKNVNFISLKREGNHLIACFSVITKASEDTNMTLGLDITYNDWIIYNDDGSVLIDSDKYWTRFPADFSEPCKCNCKHCHSHL